MQTILLATDLSAQADRALERAVHLARKHKSNLHILHVVNAVYIPSRLEWKDRPHKRIKEANEFIHACLEALPPIEGGKVFVEVRQGDPYAAILDYAREHKPDLIVMGSHNKATEELKDMFVGTTIERVIRRGEMPVLMVIDKYLGDYKKAMVATDLSPASACALRTAVRCTPDTAFKLLHAYDVPYAGLIKDDNSRKEVEQKARTEMEEFVKEELETLADEGQKPTVETMIRQGATFEAILTTVKEDKPELLVLGAHSRSGVGLTFIGSTARDFLALPPCDILVGKNIKRKS